jgi:hypothetical protein
MLPEGAECILVACHHDDQDGQQQVEPAGHPWEKFPDIGELVKVIRAEAGDGNIQPGSNKHNQEKQNEVQQYDYPESPVRPDFRKLV